MSTTDTQDTAARLIGEGLRIVEELAAELRLPQSRWQLRRYCEQGHLEAVRSGSRWLTSRAAVERMLARDTLRVRNRRRPAATNADADTAAAASRDYLASVGLAREDTAAVVADGAAETRSRSRRREAAQ